MTLYGDLTPDEQTLLRRGLQAVAVAVSAASPGRPEETVSEGFAAASFILDRRPEDAAIPLVSSLILELEAEVREDRAFPDYLAAATAEGARARALETLRELATMLDARVPPDEAAATKGWFMRIAQTVAAAGKEDQGFLGRGGVRINEVERTELREIATILGIATDTSSSPGGAGTA
jgi:hypothetical protein